MVDAWRIGNKHGLRHGFAVGGYKGKTPEYKIWIALRSRCNNPKTIGFKHYGGKGIKVCERWASFVNFLADMGPRPSPKHTIDRIDNNGDYCMANCRWATYTEQMNNKKNNIRVIFDGRSFGVSDLAKHLGLGYHATYDKFVRKGKPPRKKPKRRSKGVA